MKPETEVLFMKEQTYHIYLDMGQYIYVKRKDNKMVLIDKNDLSTGELEELTQLLLNNVKM